MPIALGRVRHLTALPSTLRRGLAVLVLTTSAATAASVAGARGRLWDEDHLLSSRERGSVERRLTAAEKRLGSPVFVLLTERLRHETAAAMAERVFSQRALAGSSGSNPVLVVIAVRDRAAAIATGKGPAGIVPEMDAAQIVRAVESQGLGGDASPTHGPQPRLTRAIETALRGIIDSAEATAARRRPSSPEDDDLPPADVPGGQLGPGPAPAGDAARAEQEGEQGVQDTGRRGDDGAEVSQQKGESPESPPGGKVARRSRLPLGIAAGALLLLGLALRRRQQMAAARHPPPPVARPFHTARPSAGHSAGENRGVPPGPLGSGAKADFKADSKANSKTEQEKK